MGKVQEVIMIKAPISEVWKYYSDVDKLHEWIAGGNIMKFEALSPPPKRVGSKFRISYRMMGRVFSWMIEIAEFLEKKRSAYKLVSGDLKRYEQSFEFNQTDEGTEVVSKVNYELPFSFLGKLLDVLVVNRQIKADIQESLMRLKTKVEK